MHLFKTLILTVIFFLSLTGRVAAEEKDELNYYLMIGKPNTATWENIVKNEVDMSIDGRKGIEQMGGKFLGFYIGVGEYKNYAIVAFPKSTDVARIVFTRAIQGVMEDIEFIPIMTTQQAQEVFKQINAVKIGGNT